MSWDNTVDYLKKNIKNFEVKEKDSSWHQKLLGKLLFYAPFMKMWTTFYPKVWKPSGRLDSWQILQHEGVHLLDAQTLYGLLPAIPVLKWINVLFFSFFYVSPQILSLLALIAISGNLWWLLCLLFLLPLPSPGRMITEMRAYRRSKELGGDIENIVENFSKSSYYFMWPFPKHVRKMLKKSSPYRSEMDGLK
jgi:hypothetical protein